MILVTGAGGLSGSIVVRELGRQGLPVRALVRPGRGPVPGVETVEGDLLRPSTLSAALADVDRALLISTADERMVEAQQTFIDTARAAGVAHIVKFSGAESGVGFDPYRFRSTRAHEQIEDYLEASGAAWTHLRPSQFMQVYLREQSIRTENALFLPLGAAELAPVDLEDVARVAAAILRDPAGHAGRGYPMTGPESLDSRAVAGHLSKATGREIRYVELTEDQARARWRAAGLSEYRIDLLSELFAERRRNPVSAVALGTHAAFGLRPTTFAAFAGREFSDPEFSDPEFSDPEFSET